MSFEVGQTAGGYEFVDIEDNSPVGRAYKVRNLRAERMEVLRVLPKEEADRFLREIKVHGRLSHPNILSFYTATEIDGEMVTTSEYFEGTTLDARLEVGPVPLLETIMCLSQVLSALNYAHELGVIHGKVSPRNILLGWDGTVKLTGFDPAKSAADPVLDGPADLYAVGAVLFEMITGTRVQTPPELPATMDASLVHIILTALARNPAERFQSARRFRDALESLVVIPSAAALEEVPVTTAAPAPAWGMQKLVLTGVVTFVVMLAIFLMFLKIGKL